MMPKSRRAAASCTRSELSAAYMKPKKFASPPVMMISLFIYAWIRERSLGRCCSCRAPGHLSERHESMREAQCAQKRATTFLIEGKQGERDRPHPCKGKTRTGESR